LSYECETAEHRRPGRVRRQTRRAAIRGCGLSSPLTPVNGLQRPSRGLAPFDRRMSCYVGDEPPVNGDQEGRFP